MLNIGIPSIWSLMIGYLVSLLVGGLIIEFFMKYLRKSSKVLEDEGKNEKKDIHLVRWLGLLERFLYTTSFLIGQPAWIAAWLAIKVLTRWSGEENRWANISEANIYLIGNLLTVLFSVFGGIIIILNK